MSGEHTIGVISDTHGLVRPEAMRALQGVDRIIHAGDVGDPEVIRILAELAPVVVVRGNVDRGGWALALPRTEVVEIGGIHLYVLHDLNELDLDPAVAGFQAVISGHSHQPSERYAGGVLYLNPGSAGPRRFKLPVSLAILRIEGSSLKAQLKYLIHP